MQSVGARIDALTGAAIGQRGESGRAETLLISGQEVSAPALRIALGSTKMRSCLLESLRVENGLVYMSGKGYGHGVGMSQWGAYAMAKEGKTAEEIVTHYFAGVVIDRFGQEVTILFNTDTYFEFSAKVMVSPTFFAWVLGFGGRMKILSPESVAEEARRIAMEVVERYDS